MSLLSGSSDSDTDSSSSSDMDVAAARPAAAASEASIDWSDPRQVFAYRTNADGMCIESPLLTMVKKASGWFARPGRSLHALTIIAPNDPMKLEVVRKIRGELAWASAAECRAVATMVGMAIGDSLGAPVEFQPYHPKGCGLIKGMGSRTQGAFSLEPGQWTDDASQGHCLAETLVANNGQFDPHGFMLRMLGWWHFGYCNGLVDRHSVGLGGNTSMSFSQYPRKGEPYTTAGDKNTCGNGSVMRNAAPAVAFWDNEVLAMDCARKQSFVTHQGDEAAECCALLAFIGCRAINGDGSLESCLSPQVLAEFQSPMPSIQCLAAAKAEPVEDAENRNWAWRSEKFRYSPKRARQQPGYIGSYCMDATAMALHCVWTTRSFSEATLKCANMCGDADSVTSVTAQVAGAIYGIGGDRGIPLEWIAKQQQWDNSGDIATRALRLFRKDYPPAAAAAAAAAATATAELAPGSD